MYQIFTTEQFEKQYSKLAPQLQREITKEIGQLEENPLVGKQLG